MSNINSGFIADFSLNVSTHFTDIELLHSSTNGYSVVYKAKRYGKWHTLKCLTPEYREYPKYKTLLQKEFEITYSLSHVNIQKTIGFENIAELGPCIISEYIDGAELTPQTCTRQVVTELCAALEYLHKLGIIHRDIKPSNILVTFDGNHVKLIDFGLADKADYTILKEPAGTTLYAAPEQLQVGEIDTRADIFALGCIMQYAAKKNVRWLYVACKCQSVNKFKRYKSAKEVSVALNRQFPWAVFVIIALFCLAISYAAFYRHSNAEISHLKNELEMSKNREENLRQVSLKAMLENDVRSHTNRAIGYLPDRIDGYVLIDSLLEHRGEYPRYIVEQYIQKPDSFFDVCLRSCCNVEDEILLARFSWRLKQNKMK